MATPMTLPLVNAEDLALSTNKEVLMSVHVESVEVFGEVEANLIKSRDRRHRNIN